jgi:hypothetical protein
MSALYFFATGPISQLTSSKLGADNVLRMVVLWANYVAYLLGLCTEEICLALLVRDFRKHIKQQWHDIFGCCCGAKKPDTTAGSFQSQTAQKHQQTIRSINVIKVNTLVPVQ